MRLVSVIRLSFALALVALLSACAVGGMSPAVTREIPAAGVGTDRAFSVVIQAFNRAGSVTGSDKAEGYVNGKTTLSVLLNAQIGKDGVIRLRGQLEGGKAILGSSVEDELDRVAKDIVASLR